MRTGSCKALACVIDLKEMKGCLIFALSGYSVHGNDNIGRGQIQLKNSDVETLLPLQVALWQVAGQVGARATIFVANPDFSLFPWHSRASFQQQTRA